MTTPKRHRYSVLICDDSEYERFRFYERQFENFNIYGVSKSKGKFIERLKFDSPDSLHKEIKKLRVTGKLPDLILLDIFYPKSGNLENISRDAIKEIILLKEKFRETREKVLSYLYPSGLELLRYIRNVDKISKTELPILAYTDKVFNFLSPNDFNELYELDPGFAFKDRDDADLKSTIPPSSEYIRLVSAIESAKKTDKRNSIFITHGRSEDWRELQSFLTDTLGITAIECAQEPNRGATIIQKIERLSEQCSYAIVVMSAEDDFGNTQIRARENVIHEIGFFQGRYGLDKVCILHEENANIPTNLAGIVYIPFERGKIDRAFRGLEVELKAVDIGMR